MPTGALRSCAEIKVSRLSMPETQRVKGKAVIQYLNGCYLLPFHSGLSLACATWAARLIAGSP